MNCLNQVIIEGRIEKMEQIPEGLSFVVSSTRVYKNAEGENEEEVSFFDVETFGHLADLIERYGKKDRGIRVVGRLKQKRWKDETGKEFSKSVIIADYVEFKPMKEEK